MEVPGRFHNAVGIDAVMRSDRLLQRRVAVAVVAVDFELLQINRQLAKRKWSHAARCEIEPRAALRLGPMHVIGMLVSHELRRNTNEQSVWLVRGFQQACGRLVQNT